MTETLACVVCREEVDEKTSSTCNSCGGLFHLNQRNDIESKDCGVVWIDDRYLALEFACQNCLDATLGDPKRVSQGHKPARKRYRRRS